MAIMHKLNEEELEQAAGGYIFDIRPELTWNLNKNNALTVYFDFQNRLKFTNQNYNAWASGLYWTYSSN